MSHARVDGIVVGMERDSGATVSDVPVGEDERARFERDGHVAFDRLIDPAAIPPLHAAFERLFSGRFESGIRPDEVNWQAGESEPDRTRQICNGWKADRIVARVVLHERLGRAVATLAGWSGVRIMIDNVLWKPPGARSLGYHQDSAFLDWLRPNDLVTCWIALDETRAAGGTLELASGSHRWPLRKPSGEFHAPEEFRRPLEEAAAAAGETPVRRFVEVPPGGGSFHHGRLWHGSGPNRTAHPRRALVLHAMRADVRLVPSRFDRGIGPIYARYRRLGDDGVDENHCPVLWRDDGYRTPGLGAWLAER